MTSYHMAVLGSVSRPYFKRFSARSSSSSRKSKFARTRSSSYRRLPSACCSSRSCVRYSTQSKNAPCPFGTSTKFSGILNQRAIVETSTALSHLHTMCQCFGFVFPAFRLPVSSSASSLNEYTSASWSIYAHCLIDLCAKATFIISSSIKCSPVSGCFSYCIILKILAFISHLLFIIYHSYHSHASNKKVCKVWFLPQKPQLYHRHHHKPLVASAR